MSVRYLVSLIAVVFAVWMAVPQVAEAQYAPPGYGRGYDDRGPPPGRYDPREERRQEEWRRQQEWDRRNNARDRRGDWDDRRGGRRGGGYCVTSRGSCPAAGPPGAPCRCEIPGFGRKRGIIQ